MNGFYTTPALADQHRARLESEAHHYRLARRTSGASRTTRPTGRPLGRLADSLRSVL
jgi:hypothetical protein